MSILTLFSALAAATACGLVVQRLNLPGGLILGAMLGAAAVTLVSGKSMSMPRVLNDAAFIIIGAAVGMTLTREAVVQLAPIVVPAVLSGLLLIGAGLGIVFLLRTMNLSVPGDVLATSPGALSVMSALAIEQGTGAAQVALFHLVRVVMVILTLPLLVPLLRAAP